MGMCSNISKMTAHQNLVSQRFKTVLARQSDIQYMHIKMSKWDVNFYVACDLSNVRPIFSRFHGSKYHALVLARQGLGLSRLSW